MKKVIFCLALLICTASCAQNFSAGIKAGANFSNFTGGNFEAVKKKAIAGFHGGVFMNFSFGALFLQPEVLISTQGARIDSVSRSYDWKVTYVNVPVLLKYRSAGGFYLEAGPQLVSKLGKRYPTKLLRILPKALIFQQLRVLGYRQRAVWVLEPVALLFYRKQEILTRLKILIPILKTVLYRLELLLHLENRMNKIQESIKTLTL